MNTAVSQTCRCSFCGKSQADVGHVVTGPGVNICDECVTLSARVIAKEPVPEFRALDEMSDDELVADVLRVLASREQVELAIVNRVRRLRARDVTWHRIGEALGMSRQSAWERFSSDDD